MKKTNTSVYRQYLRFADSKSAQDALEAAIKQAIWALGLPNDNIEVEVDALTWTTCPIDVTVIVKCPEYMMADEWEDYFMNSPHVSVTKDHLLFTYHENVREELDGFNIRVQITARSATTEEQRNILRDLGMLRKEYAPGHHYESVSCGLR